MKTIIITGPSGSGKTFLANFLRKHIKNAIIINTDSYYRDDLVVKFLSLFFIDIYDRLISLKNREISKTISSIYKNEKTPILNHIDSFPVVLVQYDNQIDILVSTNEMNSYKNLDDMIMGLNKRIANLKK